MSMLSKFGFGKALGVAMTLVEDIVMAAADGKLTITDGVKILEDVCTKFGINFDTEGIDITKK